MTDPLELRLEEWMQGTGRVEASEARDFVRALEIQPRRRMWSLANPAMARFGAVAVLVIAVGVGVGVGLTSLGGPSDRPTPPDPRAFAGDPRLARCGLTDTDQAQYVFELAHAADFQTAFPAMLRSPELERPDPAFVVVLADGAGLGYGGGRSVPGTPSSTGEEGSRICVIVGNGPDTEVNLYSGVDVAGFSPDSVRRLGPVPGETAPPPTALPTESATTSVTPSPGADWGPLAVVAPSDGTDTARTEGTVRITDGCVILDAPGSRTLLIWPADRTIWHVSESTITFDNFDGSTATVGDGDHAIVGGSGELFEDTGTIFETWLDTIDWIARPAGPCDVDGVWFVGGLSRSATSAGLPVDDSIVPISLSDHSAEATQTLRICQVGETIDADKVSGAGLIPHARDAHRYARLTGDEPELQTDDPAWLIAFNGEIPMLKGGEIWIDPTCIVVDGDGGFYATGPVTNLASGVTSTPLQVKVEPDLALPPPLR